MRIENIRVSGALYQNKIQQMTDRPDHDCVLNKRKVRMARQQRCRELLDLPARGHRGLVSRTTICLVWGKRKCTAFTISAILGPDKPDFPVLMS